MNRALLILLLAAACSSGQHTDTTDPDLDMTRELRELEARRTELRAQVGDGCSRTCQLAGMICSTSGRICDISARNPKRGDFGARCRESGNDCSEAKGSCQRCQ